MKFLKFADRVVNILGLVLFGALTGASLFYTVYFKTDYEEIPYQKGDAFLVVLFVCAVLVYLMHRGSRWVLENEQKAEKRMQILLGVVLVYVLCFGVFWTLGAHSIPVADQSYVCNAAEGFVKGDYSQLTKDSYERYLYIHPHQLGLTAFVELVFTLFGNGNILAFQLLNCVWAVVCVYSGYRVTRILTIRRRAHIYYLFLVTGCFPLFFYVTYVYGEILSLAFSLLAIWMFLDYQKGGRVFCFAVSCLTASLACLIRNNCIIIVMAMACVLAATGIGRKKPGRFIQLGLLLLSLLSARWGLRTLYEVRADIELNDGAPMILYVAMGMQEGSAPGWYNNYVLHIYWGETDFDGEAATEMAVSDIKKRARYFMENPAYAGNFYMDKFTSQWNNPDYQCFVLTNVNGAERCGIVNSMYDGKLHTLMTWFMNQYQSLVFIGVLLWLIYGFCQEEKLENKLLLVVIFGGFLFHMIWEAKGRYILPYFVMMLPMAAIGLEEVSEKVKAKLSVLRENTLLDAGSPINRNTGV